MFWCKHIERHCLIRDIRGQAMVEFVLCAVTFLFTILGVIQLALVLNAMSLVRYAAHNAVRAGIVHSGDLEKMEEAARLSLLPVFPRHGRADHARGYVDNYLGALATDSEPAYTFLGDPITQVEILGLDRFPCDTVVTFDDPVTADQGILTVQVVHHYELVIPLVNRIIFYLYWRFRQGERYRGQTVDFLAAETHRLRSGGEFEDIEYRIPLVSTNTMRLQSDFVRNCEP